MNLIVHQSIVINNLKVGGVSNSSVLQIGSAGVVRALSNLYNSGGFTGPAPKLTSSEGQLMAEPGETGQQEFAVPLPSPAPG